MQQAMPRAAAGNHFVMTAPVNLGRAYYRHRSPRLQGLGTSSTLAVQAGGAAAGAGVSIAAAASWIPLAAVPVIGAAIAAISIGIELILNSGCGQTCIVTSNWANQAEQLLQQNITAYFQLPTPRSQSQQAAALANFDQVWNYLKTQCSSPSLGQAGVNCIADRQSGACHWTQPASSVPPWGTPPAGACWNWFNGYRDPIANDSPIVADPVQTAATTAAGTVSSTIASVSAATGLSSTTIIFSAAALLLLAVIGGGK